METCPACTADAKSLGARIATLCSSSKRRKSIKSIALDESNIGAACGAFDNAATIAQKKDAFRMSWTRRGSNPRPFDDSRVARALRVEVKLSSN